MSSERRPFVIEYNSLSRIASLVTKRSSLTVSHYRDVIMSRMASQMTSVSIVYSTVRWSKKTPKLCVNGLCESNSPVAGEFPAQRTSNAENVSIWWRHHAKHYISFPHLYLIKSQSITRPQVLLSRLRNNTSGWYRTIATTRQHVGVILC